MIEEDFCFARTLCDESIIIMYILNYSKFQMASSVAVKQHGVLIDLRKQ